MSLAVAITHRLDSFALDAQFEAPAGVTALFGRSGAGKTTVVNAIAGLLRPDTARITVDGTPLIDTAAGHWVPPHRRRIGYVFQEARLLPHLSVRGNLAYGARRTGGVDQTALAEVADLLGIAPLLTRRIGALSGGERQRVAIGRALLARPRLLLLDEPLAALDAARKAEILPYLERLRDDTQVPIVYVSHAVSEIARLARTVVVLESGRVIRAGPTAEVLSDPGTVPALGQRDAGAVLSGRLVARHDDGLAEVAVTAGPLFLPDFEAPLGTPVRIRIAAGDVILASVRPEGLSALNILPATVTALREGTGPGVAVQLRAGEDFILARITRRSARALALAPGRPCHAVIKSVSIAKTDVGRDGL